MGGVAVVGSLNMDLLFQAARWPAAGETIHGERMRTLPGGKGLNQAAAARRAGAPVSLIGRLGTDGFGQALRTVLADEGLDDRLVERDAGAGTGVALIRVDAAGGNAIVVVAGANGQMTAEQVDRAAGEIRGAAVLLLQAEVPLAASLRAAEIARRAGRIVVWNPAPAPPPGSELDRLLALADWVLPNEIELAALAGAGGEDGARALRGRSGGPILATLGDAGALLITDPAAAGRHVPAYGVDVVDTVGAGDAFAGVFAASLAGGTGVPRAIALAAAAGALACTRPGGLPSMPRSEQILRLVGCGR